MSEMVERVARAICAKHYADRFKKTETDAHVMANVDANWVDYEPAARAAIEAMREPSEAMCTAGDKCCGEYGCGVSRMREIFTAQIDAALQD